MYIREFFDYEKAVEVFLYIITEYPDVSPDYLLSEANICSLYKYRRTICGQTNMHSCEFEALVSILSIDGVIPNIATEIGDCRFKPLRDYDGDFLSKCDKKCLQEAFDNYDLNEY